MHFIIQLNSVYEESPSPSGRKANTTRTKHSLGHPFARYRTQSCSKHMANGSYFVYLRCSLMPSSTSNRKTSAFKLLIKNFVVNLFSLCNDTRQLGKQKFMVNLKDFLIQTKVWVSHAKYSSTMFKSSTFEEFQVTNSAQMSQQQPNGSM